MFFLAIGLTLMAPLPELPKHGSTRKHIIKARLEKIKKKLQHEKLAPIPKPREALEMIASLEKYRKLVTPEERAQLLFFQAQALDLAISDLGRDSGIRISQVIQKYQELIAFENSVPIDIYGSQAKERIAELQKVEPYLMLRRLEQMGKCYNGEVGVIVLAERIIDHPNATPQMKSIAARYKQIALRKFGL